jgi:hypothetical protein
VATLGSGRSPRHVAVQEASRILAVAFLLNWNLGGEARSGVRGIHGAVSVPPATLPADGGNRRPLDAGAVGHRDGPDPHQIRHGASLPWPFSVPPVQWQWNAALAASRWTYNALMPIWPIVDVGLWPVAQMTILPVITMWLARVSRRL